MYEGYYQVSPTNDAEKGEEFVKKSTSPEKKLGVVSLAILTVNVNGGPFGIEDIVRAGGPFFALMGFSLLLVWALPEALITAELGSAFPESSGSVAWVEAAFGPFWAFQKGWLSWFSGVADNALYPILFYDCLMQLLSGLGADFAEEPYIRLLFLISLTAMLTWLNLRGLDVVSNVAIVICLVSLCPFLIFCIVGAFKVQPSKWLQVPKDGAKGVDWRLLLNTFFWNINFWESAASFSGEVMEPERNFPLGMIFAIFLVFVSSFFPILIGIGISPDPTSEWRDGYFVRLGEIAGGKWLSIFMMVGSAITNIAMFESEMSSDAWQLCGMAETGHLPSVFAVRNEQDVPMYAVLLSACGVMLLGVMTFSEVIDMLNLLYCFGQLIEFCAFLHLRYRRPDLVRPFRVPLGSIGMTLLLLLPFIFILIIISFSSWYCLLVSLFIAATGPGAYFLIDMAKERRWCEFELAPEKSQHFTATG